MKKRPVLYLAMILSLVIELILIIAVYIKIGDEHLPRQIGRFVIQIILILIISMRTSNTALFLLMTYHILSGIFIFYSDNATDLLGIALILYHTVIGLAIYFHDWIEEKCKCIPISKISDREEFKIDNK